MYILYQDFLFCPTYFLSFFLLDVPEVLDVNVFIMYKIKCNIPSLPIQVVITRRKTVKLLLLIRPVMDRCIYNTIVLHCLYITLTTQRESALAAYHYPNWSMGWDSNPHRTDLQSDA